MPGNDRSDILAGKATEKVKSWKFIPLAQLNFRICKKFRAAKQE
jgi:hypothetical protein